MFFIQLKHDHFVWEVEIIFLPDVFRNYELRNSSIFVVTSFEDGYEIKV